MSLTSELTGTADPYAAWKGWDEATFAQYSASDARYFDWHLQRACGAAPKASQVLEIGFGNGRFMGWLRAQGHQVQGIETNARLVDVARRAGFVAGADVGDVPAELRFDLIAAFDVLEHVPPAALEALLNTLATRLQPQGRLLLRFPNGESPFGLWMQHGDLTHVHALGLSKVAQLCAACGLKMLHSGEALPWQQQAVGRRLGAAFAHWQRSRFERKLRKMYRLPRGLDLSPNQLVVLSRA
jgi:2-polyprenyl-3-methyl-5-hydroxy-6-metoxy-1,4-benzoquinol methylase